MASDTFRSPPDPCPPTNAQLTRTLHDFAAALPCGRACGPALTPAAGAAPMQQAEARIKIYNATRSKTINLGSLRFQGIAASGARFPVSRPATYALMAASGTAEQSGCG